MRKLHGWIAAVAMAVVASLAGTNAQNAAPYKLGMFEQNGRQFVGMVIQNDTAVVDLSRANVNAPATLKQLIAGWDANMGAALAALAAKPAATIPIKQLKTLPPIPDPSALLNAAVNYSEHGMEMTRPGHRRRQRRQSRSESGTWAFPATGTASPAIRGRTRITS